MFKTWEQVKGNNIQSITTLLHSINPKWKLSSATPSFDSDKETKYWIWTAVTSSKDTSAFALYIDEDESTTKYSLRYAFHSKVGYQSLATALKADPYYLGRVTTQTDNSKGEVSLLALANDDLPMPKRIDFLLSDYNLNSSDDHPRLFTVDINSRYIPKQ